MPSASMAEAIVLAVYMPPQAPAPGQLCCTISLRSSSLDLAGQVFAVALKGRDDVELVSPSRCARLDRAAVDHQRRAG